MPGAPAATLSSVMLLLLAACSDYDLVAGPVDVDPGDVVDCAFTRVEDTDFYAYDCNPVFTTTGEAWAPTIDSTTFVVTEVMGHPFYQLWYTGVPDADALGDYALGYAVSADGTEWIPNPENPLLEDEAGAWDASSMDAMQVVWDPGTGQYVMVYQGLNEAQGNLDLGVATSPDGVAWTRYAGNPVLDLTAAAAGLQGWCWPLGLSLGPVTGYTGYIAGIADRSDACEVYQLNAADITTWTPSDDKVLPAGEDGEWDDKGFVSLATAELDDHAYLFYAGFGDWQQTGAYQTSRHHFFGMAEEQDGHWVKHGAPIPLNTTEEGEVVSVAARKVGSRIHLWVTDNWGDTSGVGYFLFDPHRAAQEDGR